MMSNDPFAAASEVIEASAAADLSHTAAVQADLAVAGEKRRRCKIGDDTTGCDNYRSNPAALHSKSLHVLPSLQQGHTPPPRLPATPYNSTAVVVHTSSATETSSKAKSAHETVSMLAAHDTTATVGTYTKTMLRSDPQSKKSTTAVDLTTTTTDCAAAAVGAATTTTTTTTTTNATTANGADDFSNTTSRSAASVSGQIVHIRKLSKRLVFFDLEPLDNPTAIQATDTAAAESRACVHTNSSGQQIDCDKTSRCSQREPSCCGDALASEAAAATQHKSMTSSSLALAMTSDAVGSRVAVILKHHDSPAEPIPQILARLHLGDVVRVHGWQEKAKAKEKTTTTSASASAGGLGTKYYDQNQQDSVNVETLPGPFHCISVSVLQLWRDAHPGLGFVPRPVSMRRHCNGRGGDGDSSRDKPEPTSTIACDASKSSDGSTSSYPAVEKAEIKNDIILGCDGSDRSSTAGVDGDHSRQALQPPCKYWFNTGRCSRQNCAFRHDLDPGALAGIRASHVQAQLRSKQKRYTEALASSVHKVWVDTSDHDGGIQGQQGSGLVMQRGDKKEGEEEMSEQESIEEEEEEEEEEDEHQHEAPVAVLLESTESVRDSTESAMSASSLQLRRRQQQRRNSSSKNSTGKSLSLHGFVPKHQRARVFCSFVMATFGGHARLSQGTGVLDVAGGRGDVSFEMSVRYGVTCTCVDPRPAKPTLRQLRYLRRTQHGLATSSCPAATAPTTAPTTIATAPPITTANNTTNPNPNPNLNPKVSSPSKMISKNTMAALTVSAIVASEMECQETETETEVENGDKKAAKEGRRRKLHQKVATTPAVCLPPQQHHTATTNTTLFPHITCYFGPDMMLNPAHAALLKGATAVIAMHPDQATEPAVDFAIERGLPWAVVPCCVFALENPHRKTPDGLPVTSYEQFVQYLCRKQPGTRTATLGFYGKNVVVYNTTAL